MRRLIKMRMIENEFSFFVSEYEREDSGFEKKRRKNMCSLLEKKLGFATGIDESTSTVALTTQ